MMPLGPLCIRSRSVRFLGIYSIVHTWRALEAHSRKFVCVYSRSEVVLFADDGCVYVCVCVSTGDPRCGELAIYVDEDHRDTVFTTGCRQPERTSYTWDVTGSWRRRSLMDPDRIVTTFCRPSLSVVPDRSSDGSVIVWGNWEFHVLYGSPTLYR